MTDDYEWDDLDDDDVETTTGQAEQHRAYDPDLWADGYLSYLHYLEQQSNGKNNHRDDTAVVRDEIRSQTVAQLKDRLRERQLRLTGRKVGLQERLWDAYTAYTHRPHLRWTTPQELTDDSDGDSDDADEYEGYSSDEEDYSSGVDDGDDKMSYSPPPAPPRESILYCFDTANQYRLVEKRVLEQQGRIQDAMVGPQSSTEPVNDGENNSDDSGDDDNQAEIVPQQPEAQSLLDLLPPEMTADFPSHLVPELMEIVLDVGKRPFAWVRGQRHFLGSSTDMTVTPEHLRRIVEPLHFGPDNRAGINGSLHRISAIRNREGGCIGLTLRVGRYVPGNALMIADVLVGMPQASILIVGDPGSGKTSIIRDAARFLAEQHSLLIIDTSCEIGGSGDVPHECIGLSRRMQVKNIESQAQVMVECVQNHTPGVMVIDEIGRPAEVQAALTCKERGVRMIASAHGNLSGLVRNASLCDMVGGVDVVTVGDKAAREEAQRRGSQKEGIASKLNAQRRGPPIFDVVIEVKRGYLHEWHVILNSAAAVDSILSNGNYSVQARYRENSGASAVQLKTLSKNASALDEIREKGIRSDSMLNNIPNAPAGVDTNDEMDPLFRYFREDGSLSGPTHLNPFSKKCMTCPNCRKKLKNRKGLISHAFSKGKCRSNLPDEILEHLAEEAHTIGYSLPLA